MPVCTQPGPEASQGCGGSLAFQPALPNVCWTLKPGVGALSPHVTCCCHRRLAWPASVRAGVRGSRGSVFVIVNLNVYVLVCFDSCRSFRTVFSIFVAPSCRAVWWEGFLLYLCLFAVLWALG